MEFRGFHSAPRASLRRLAFFGLVGLATAAFGAAACSGAGSSPNAFDNGTGGGGTTGSTGGTTATGLTTSGSGGQTFAVGSAGSSPGVGGGCAGTTVKAEKLPLDMYIMLDQSSSMSDPVSSGTDKWTAVTSALESFVKQPQTAGIGVGLQYFGLAPGGGACPTTCSSDADCGACGPCDLFFGFGFCEGAGGDSCSAADYAKPEVEIAPLPGVASKILSSISNHGPTTGTPTSAALQGAVDHAGTWATSHPTHTVIAVLATDGDPSECDMDLGNIDSIAQSAAAGNPKVLTFVIGVGSSLSALNGIAAAGGTGKAFLVDTNQNAEQQFLDAMNKIQGAALGCTYSIPVPQMGTPDYNAVNVQYTPGGSGSAETFPKVANQGACPSTGNGWYYDDNAAPTKIILCDGSCTTVSSDSMGSIDIVLGCTTIVK